jgi:valyl-tRNA synthetase
MELSAKYNPTEVESKWYDHWEEQGYFHSEPDEREPFTILIPPPNVTGVLHMGHMLNNTIQDILVRRARAEGKNACWVPGTDHASIATEAKVVQMLRKQGIKKSDLTREEFLAHAWKWKEEYGGIILKQLRSLGASCDWNRTAFTMDETRSHAVIKAFVDLYKKGFLYRKKRMVNWDPEAKTVLSNEEVIYSSEQSALYYVEYEIDGSEERLTIATTRPETILGDTGIAVHPEDERYKHLHGKFAIVPLVNRKIPIIADDYVDKEFGTGALKVTPAHDVNDFEIGQRHGLEVVDVLEEDGSLSEAAGFFVGMDRFEARKEMSEWLKANGHLVKKETLINNVGRSERTNAVIEPRLSLQWYVSMSDLSDKALEAVNTDEVEFFPKNQKNIYNHWMTNIRDWCISRQLWWGHRIPAWYYEGEVFVAETPEGALSAAISHFNDTSIKLEDLHQDEDVLDTWFSSWLWPISVFDGFRNQREIDYYYPTSVLVTGWDIIFLWVARMIMAGYEWRGERPFETVYFTGMVRDKQRRKMSKSLGNSPDALGLIEKYGADGVRFGMLSCSPAGGDLLFDEKLCEQGSKFCIKLWNALKLTKTWKVSSDLPISVADRFAIEALENGLAQLENEIQDGLKTFRLSEVLIKLYTFIWGDFCSWYLECIKPSDGVISQEVLERTNDLFERICVILHPFMPFITEEIYHQLKERSAGDDCMAAQLRVGAPFDGDVIRRYDSFKSIVSAIRDLRNKHNVGRDESPELVMVSTMITMDWYHDSGMMGCLIKMAGISRIELKESLSSTKGVAFIVGAESLSFGVESSVDKEDELMRLNEELNYARGFLASVNKKLSNERFVQNAPAEVVEVEKKKQADGEERVRILEQSIKDLE